MTSPLQRMKIRIDTRNNMENVSNTFGSFPQRTAGIHQGWDLEALPGTTIFAVSNGTVVDVNPNDSGSGYGRSITLEFDFRGRKLYAFYGHLQMISPAIRKGKTVKEGEQLGTTGTSGNASGIRRGEEHLHFEIRTQAAIPKGFGLMYRLDPGEVLGYGIYSCSSASNTSALQSTANQSSQRNSSPSAGTILP